MTIIRPLGLAAAAAVSALVAVPLQPLAARSGQQTQVTTRAFYLDLIREARRDGRSRAALAFLDDFDRQYPGDVEAMVLRINCLLDLGQAAEAESAARSLPSGERAARLGAHAARGHVSAAQDRWADAARHYTAAVAAKPADSGLLNALGYAQIRAGQAHGAITTLRSASELSPKSVVIRNNLLLALLLGGEADALREALARIPDAEDRARIDAQLRSEGEKIVRQLAATRPTDPPAEKRS